MAWISDFIRDSFKIRVKIWLKIWFNILIRIGINAEFKIRRKKWSQDGSQNCLIIAPRPFIDSILALVSIRCFKKHHKISSIRIDQCQLVEGKVQSVVHYILRWNYITGKNVNCSCVASLDLVDQHLCQQLLCFEFRIVP